MHFNQCLVMCSKPPEWNFSIKAENKTEKQGYFFLYKNIYLLFIVHDNG